MIRRFEGAARAIAVTFWFMTATFSWLVSVPFAYRNFIQPRLLQYLLEDMLQVLLFLGNMIPTKSKAQGRRHALARGACKEDTDDETQASEQDKHHGPYGG